MAANNLNEELNIISAQGEIWRRGDELEELDSPPDDISAGNPTDITDVTDDKLVNENFYQSKNSEQCFMDLSDTNINELAVNHENSHIKSDELSKYPVEPMNDSSIEEMVIDESTNNDTICKNSTSINLEKSDIGKVKNHTNSDSRVPDKMQVQQQKSMPDKENCDSTNKLNGNQLNCSDSSKLSLVEKNVSGSNDHESFGKKEKKPPDNQIVNETLKEISSHDVFSEKTNTIIQGTEVKENLKCSNQSYNKNSVFSTDSTRVKCKFSVNSDSYKMTTDNKFDVENRLHQMFGGDFSINEAVILKSCPKEKKLKQSDKASAHKKSKIMNDLIEIFGFDEAFLKYFKSTKKFKPNASSFEKSISDSAKSKMLNIFSHKIPKKQKKVPDKENVKNKTAKQRTVPKLIQKKNKKPIKRNIAQDDDFDNFTTNSKFAENTSRRKSPVEKPKGLLKVVIGKPKREVYDLTENVKPKKPVGPKSKTMQKVKQIENEAFNKDQTLSLNNTIDLNDNSDDEYKPEESMQSSLSTCSSTSSTANTSSSANMQSINSRQHLYESVYIGKLQDHCLEGHPLDMFKASVNVNTGEIGVYCDICEKKLIMNCKALQDS